MTSTGFDSHSNLSYNLQPESYWEPVVLSEVRGSLSETKRRRKTALMCSPKCERRNEDGLRARGVSVMFLNQESAAGAKDCFSPSLPLSCSPHHDKNQKLSLPSNSSKHCCHKTISSNVDFTTLAFFQLSTSFNSRLP